MSFASPWLLVLLVAIPGVVASYVSAVRRRARRAAHLASQALVLTSTAQRVGKKRHVPFALFALALTVLVVAVARPQTNLTTPHREGTVILAFDVSNSMAAKDLEPTRLDAAKAAAHAFVVQQPSTIRIGVVAFGDGSVIALQPTTTQADVLAAIDRLTLEGGTSLGQGIFASLNAIAGKALVIDPAALESDTAQVDIGYYGSSQIILLSDGENTGNPDPLTVAQIASVAGVKINTIGIGTEAGAVVDIKGFKAATALDSDLLTQIATVSNGTYYQATDAKSLADIYKSIHLEITTTTKHTEVTALFTIVGSLLLVVGALLSVLWFGRVV